MSDSEDEQPDVEAPEDGKGKAEWPELDDYIKAAAGMRHAT